MFTTCLMFSDNGCFYIGQTTDLAHRLWQRNSYKNKRAVSHRMGNRWKLIATREWATREEALECERRIKRASGRLAWIMENAGLVQDIVRRQKFRLPKELGGWCGDRGKRAQAHSVTAGAGWRRRGIQEGG